MNVLVPGFSMTMLRTLIGLGLTLVLVQQAAAQPEDPAPLSLVEESVAVCLEVPHAEATWRRVEASRLVTRLKAFPPLARLLERGGLQKWDMLEAHVQRTTGKTLSAHLLTACSESLVFAIYAPQNQRPEGVVLAQARDADTLTRTIAAWGTLEPQHTSTTKKHLGRSYVHRMKSGNAQGSLFYVVLGRTIVLSDQEHRIHQAIEFAAGQSSSRPWQDSEAYRASRTRLSAAADAFVDLNPRAWESAVTSGLANSPDAAWLGVVYRQLSAVSAALRLDDEVVLELILEARNSPLSSAWLPRDTTPLSKWSERVPGAAIVAVSSQWPVGALIQAWLNYAPDAKTEDFQRGRKALRSVLQDHDLFTEVLPGFLSNWTLTVVPGRSDSFPLDAIGEFQIPEKPQGLAKNIDHAVQFGMTAMAVGLTIEKATSSTVYVDSREFEGAQIHALRGLPAWSPAVAISTDRLRITTSAAELTNPLTMSAPSERLEFYERRYFPKTSQLVWLDSVRLHELLEKHSDRLVQLVAPPDSEHSERLQRQLGRVNEASQIFDAAFFAIRSDEHSLRFVVGAALDRTPR